MYGNSLSSESMVIVDPDSALCGNADILVQYYVAKFYFIARHLFKIIFSVSLRIFILESTI
jgi:hypothetical protein